MSYDNLLNDLINASNSAQAKQMSAYMKNQFEFLGLPSAKRMALADKYLKELKKLKEIDWDFVSQCWDCKYRELQYIAVDYLLSKEKYMTDNDVNNLKQLITKKSWWDSVDSFNRIFGTLSIKYPIISDLMLKWSADNNMWLQRTAIIYQLHLKDKTNTEMLEKIICNNLGTDEFFINKAIGWSLREYSKTNPCWVRAFMDKYKDALSKLSVKEGSKYL